MKNYIVHIQGQTDITIRADTPIDAEYEALEELINCSDSQFDREIVKIFVEIIKKGELPFFQSA